MAEVKVIINDKEYSAGSDKTILQVVREYSIDEIPALCYEERLGHMTSCFLCVVEVEGARSLVPSCSTKIAEGMSIRTRTEKVIEARKTCLELLFSDHYADCISPCAMKCPAGVDIQGYLTLVKKGFYREAIELIKEKNPLPIVCGRVCVRECEVGCRRNLLDQPVGIDYLKRYAAESAEGMSFLPEKKPSTGKSVVILGAGPAGLSAAYYLAVEGYDVTIFEAMPQPGGMLRYGIPAYRLPKNLLDHEIDSIKKLGVKIICNKKMGEDLNLIDLKAEFHSVLIATGAWGAMGLGVENEDTPGVLSALQVLRQTAEGALKSLPGRVLIIGGGNTAIDACRTALRLGAEEVAVLYRRTEAQMPAHQEEIDAAKHEGVVFKFLTAPVKVITDSDGKLTGLECIQMELGEPDSSGRPRPVPIENSNYIEPCSFILAAIGQFPDLKCLETPDEGCKIELTRRGRISVNADTMETNIPGIFSTGDVVTGPATAIEGIAGGRNAAYAIHSFLSRGKAEQRPKEFVINKDIFGGVTCSDVGCFEKCERCSMPERDPNERILDFNEVELGITGDDVQWEAERCFQCGCVEVDECLLRKFAEDYSIDIKRFIGEVNRYDVDRRHPFIAIDPNKCIKCGRCVKTCENILGASALGFVNRGFGTIIAPSMEKPLLQTTCIACGNCIDTCPTGAISENLPLFGRISDKTLDNPSVCGFCSAGCKINFKTFGRDMRIRSLRDKSTGYGDYLCKKGRFGSNYSSSPHRILQPSIKIDGKITAASWDDAIKTTADNLNIIKHKYGNNSIGVFISPKYTNEEIYAAVKFARKTTGTDILGSFGGILSRRDHHALDPMLGFTATTNPMDHILDAETILLVNSNPFETHPSFGMKIREAGQKGARIIVIKSSNAVSIRDASLWIQARKGTSTYVINSIMNEIISNNEYNHKYIHDKTVDFESFKEFLKDYPIDESSRISGADKEKIKEASQMLSKSRVMVVYDMNSNIDRATGDLEALANLLLLTGNLGSRGGGLYLLPKDSNSTGIIDMGAEPGYLPGRISLEDYYNSPISDIWGDISIESLSSHELCNLFTSKKLKAGLFLGENPLENPENMEFLRHLEFIGVMDIFMSETCHIAQVILPGSTHMESNGSYTRLDRKIQPFKGVKPPVTGRTNLEVINKLSEAMGIPVNLESVVITQNEISQINRLYKDFKPGAESFFWNPSCRSCSCGVLYCGRFGTESGKAGFSTCGTDTKTWKHDCFSYSMIESFFEQEVNPLLKRDSCLCLF